MSALLIVAASERELCPIDGVRSLCCGIGPVEAALMTARALADRPAAAVLHVGIGGAGDLDPGTIVIGSESIYCDIIDPNATLPRVTRVDPAPELVAAASRALPDALISPIATTGRVGGALGHAPEAMEGFGVLRAAELAGAAAVEIRAISNHPAVVDRTQWQIVDALSVLHLAIAAVVPALLEVVGAADRR